MKLIKKFKSIFFKRHRERAQLSLVSPTDRHVFIEDNLVQVGSFTYGVDNIKLIHHPGCPPLSIGRYCSIGQEVTIILGAYHRSDWISTYPFSSSHQSISAYFGHPQTPGFPKSKGAVSIGNDVWIGHGATIMSGVNIGDGAVIAANSHVVQDVLPYEIVGGNPAAHIRFRFMPKIIEQLMELRWWELPHERIKEIVPQLSQEPSYELVKELLNIRSPHHTPLGL